ncbi:MAG: DinB family protein [Bacteroidota bacterium]
MTTEEIFVKMAIDSWQQQINATNSTFDKLSDERLMDEIAPSKNRGIYLLGHLVAVHDRMLPLLRFEDAAHPELTPIFLEAPDKTVTDLPPVGQLREQWKAVNEKLQNHFNSLSPADWLTRHASVSEEDFAKEPHRNRLNVLLSRTNHVANHRGQLAMLVRA